MKNENCKKDRTRRIKKQIILFGLVTIVLILGCVLIAKSKSTKNSSNVVDEVATSPKPTSTPKVEENPYHIKKVVTYKKGKLLSKHTTTNAASYGNRNINLEVAARIINTKQKTKKFKGKGYLLMPEKTFSWLKTVGKPTEEKGFKYAGVIVNKQPATGIAGGYCQNATSLNTASVKAGLDTISQKHSVKPSYLTSEDIESTISYDSQVDLKITNNLKYPVIIRQIANGGSVTTKVFKAKKKVKYIEY